MKRLEGRIIRLESRLGISNGSMEELLKRQLEQFFGPKGINGINNAMVVTDILRIMRIGEKTSVSVVVKELPQPLRDHMAQIYGELMRRKAKEQEASGVRTRAKIK